MKSKLMLSAILCSLFMFFGCGEKNIITKGIPDAENSTFTTDGRLFVTGGKDVYEILPDGNGGFKAEDRYNGTGNFLGITQVGNFVYAICMKNEFYPCNAGCNLTSIEGILQCFSDVFTEKVLMRARIFDEAGNKIIRPMFEDFMMLENVLIPNGMAADAQGNLYIADETFLPQGKIIKVNPSAKTQRIWLSASTGAFSPNGMAIRGNYLYFTDYDSRNLIHKAMIKKVEIRGEYPGPVLTVFERTGGLISPFSLFDDMTVGTIDGYNVIIACDFVKGSLVFFEDTNIKKSKPDYEADLSLDNPSSVKIGRGPMFSNDDLIVTEKGLMFIDPWSNYGNGLIRIGIHE